MLQVFETANEAFSQAAKSVVGTPFKNILVSGGSAAQIIVYLRQEISLKGVHIWISDERCVSANDPDSNSHLLQTLLHTTEATLHCWNTDIPIQTSLESYAKTLPDFFDYAFLGAGPDGHIMSLFPQETGKKIAAESQGLCVHTTTNTFAVKNRLSLTQKALNRSRSVVLLLSGEAKKPVLHSIKTMDATPVGQLAKNHKNLSTYFGVTH